MGLQLGGRKNMNDGNFVCALNSDTGIWYTTESFATRIEAINAGIKGIINKDPDIFGEEVEDGWTTFAVGQIEIATIDLEHEVELLFESLNESVFDQCGEVAEDYLMDVDKKTKNKLVRLIGDFFAKNDLSPTCYNIVNIQEYDIKDLYGSYIKNGTFEDFKSNEWRTAFDEVDKWS